MGFPNQKDKKKFVFNKGSYKSQCAYMLMLIRQKSPKDWVKLKQEFAETSDDDSYDFFEKLVAIYKGEEVPVKAEKESAVLPMSKKTEKPNKASKSKKSEDKKDDDKKASKKTAKKKAAKKTVKKAAKKKAAKKTVKKAAKKKVAKKAAKKTAKKKVAKKTAKKKASKK